MKNILAKYKGRVGGAALRRLLAAALGIFICTVSFCSVTYAWFVSNVENSGNRLESGRFELDVSVSDSATPMASVTVSKLDNGSFECVLPSAGIYTVTLTMKDSTVSRGFCCVKIGDVEHTTGVIGKSVNESHETDRFTFCLEVEASEKVIFKPYWGIPSSPTVENGGNLSLGE